jgi:hypothetical protein
MREPCPFMLHFRQKYLGIREFTYILFPQEQCAGPLKRCAGALPGFFHVFSGSSMI